MYSSDDELLVLALCAEPAGQPPQQQQQQETVTVSFIDFDDDDCVSLAAERSKPSQHSQCYLSALLLNLTADQTLDEVRTLHQGLSLYLHCIRQLSSSSVISLFHHDTLPTGLQPDCLHGLRTTLRYVLVHPLSFF